MVPTALPRQFVTSNMATDLKFKMAASVGDTFTDANPSDVILNAVNGPAGRAIVAGFTTTGGAAVTSSLRIAPNAVSVLGALSASTLSAGGATFTTITSTGAASMHGITNAGSVTSTGGDVRIDNNGITTMLINQYNNTPNTNNTTGFWRLASIPVGPGGAVGGLDIDGSFSRVDNVCNLKFSSTVTGSAPPTIPYVAISEVTSASSASKIQMYLNTTTAGASVIDYYIFLDSYTRAAFTLRGYLNNFTYFNPVPVFGPAPTLSSTYALVYDTSTASVVSMGVGQVNVLGALSVSGNVLASNLSVTGNFTTTGNTFSTGRSNIGAVSYFSSIVDAGTATVGGSLMANGGVMVNNTTVIDTSANATFQNVTVLGTLTSSAPTGAPASVVSSFRNRIHNGDMRIDQRFNGSPQTGLTGGYFRVADRFVLPSTSGALTVQVQSNSTYAAMGAALGVFFPSNLSILVTTADATPAAGDFINLYQHLEGQTISDFGWGTASALPVTLSFYVSSSLVGTFSAGLKGGNSQTVASSFTITTKGVWSRVTLTFPGNTTPGWATDTSQGLEAFITLLPSSAAGVVTTAGAWQSGTQYAAVANQTNFMGAVGNQMFITGVQLEKSASATPFEFRPYSTELLLCQRYYYQMRNSTLSTSYTSYGMAYVEGASGYVRAMISLPTPMRAPPILILNEGNTGSAPIQLSGNRNADTLYVYIGGIEYVINNTVQMVDVPVPNNTPTLLKLALSGCAVNNAASGSTPASMTYPTPGLAGELISANVGSKFVAFSAEI